MSARKVNRQAFGSVRKLASGRWQARYRDQAGRPMTAPSTFDTKRAALDHLASVQADRMRGVYRDHRDGAQIFSEYAEEWISNGGSRGRLAPKTAELYRGLIARDLEHFGPLALSAITPAEVRRWFTRARRDTAARAAKRGGTGATSLRQSYAFLRAVMATAVRDRLIGENPCQIVGAGVAKSPERPYLAPDVLANIVDAMPQHYQTPMRVMFGAHLRLGELIALERGDYDEAAGTLTVERQSVDVGGSAQVTPTKTGEARVVALPPSVAVMITEHLSSANGFGRSPMFPGSSGSGITRGGVQQAWRSATKRLGLEQFHVHDVRHAGLTIAAQAGATTRELMARAGHRTAAASLVYQHVAHERTAALAAQMDAVSGGAFGRSSGTRVAQAPVQPLPIAVGDKDGNAL